MAHRLRAGLICLLLAAPYAATAAESLPRAKQADLDGSSIESLCREIGNKLGSVSVDDCLGQNLSSSGNYSVLGRSLAVKEYPPLGQKKPLGRILVIGGIHGDEYASVSVLFKWMEILNIHHSGLFHWHFLPLSNPDGLLRRKSQRQNEHGVDLNRNFPSSDWEEHALEYWSRRRGRNPRRFPGPGPASEPEIRHLVQEIEAFQPDIIISIHAPYGLVDHDGPPTAPDKLGYLRLRRLGVYPGSLGNYAGVNLNIAVVTVELKYAGIMPPPSQISVMWTDLVRWLIRERRK